MTFPAPDALPAVVAKGRWPEMSTATRKPRDTTPEGSHVNDTDLGTYQCENCDGVFEKTRTDEEAIAEMRATWKPAPGDEELGVICDDCYQWLMARVRSEAPELLAAPAAAAGRHPGGGT